MRGIGDGGGAVRPTYAALSDWLGQIKPDVLDLRRREAELLFRRIGITFAVYGDPEAQERLIPFDVIPRILSAAEWETLRRGRRNVVVGNVVAVGSDGILARAGERLMVLLGVNDLVVVDTADAILIAQRSRSQEIRRVIDELERRHLTRYL